MKRLIFIAFFLGCLIFFTFNSFGQNSIANSPVLKGKKNKVSVSVPFLWSRYEVTNLYGIYGADKQSSGESWSNGVNTTYSRKIFRGLFVTAGIGYFKQNFDFSKSRIPNGGSFRISNSRPFDYISPVSLLFSTKSYSYTNYHFILGIGYNYPISAKLDIEGSITYNQMNTYKQKYYPDNVSYAPQVSRLHYLFSKSFVISVGGEWKLNPKISTGINVIIPLSIKYRKDSIFKENTSEYFMPKSSLGISLSINYHF